MSTHANNRPKWLLEAEKLCPGQALESVIKPVKVTGGWSVQIDWSGKKSGNLETLTHKHVFESKALASDFIKSRMLLQVTVSGDNVGTPFIQQANWIRGFRADPEVVALPALDFEF